jgi:hypothetical protein
VKRILVLLTVALVMAAMMAASAMPAFAVLPANENAGHACVHFGANHVPFCRI